MLKNKIYKIVLRAQSPEHPALTLSDLSIYPSTESQRFVAGITFAVCCGSEPEESLPLVLINFSLLGVIRFNGCVWSFCDLQKATVLALSRGRPSPTTHTTAAIQTNMSSPYGKKPAPSVDTIDPYMLYDSRPIYSHAATTAGPCRIVATAGQVGCDHNRVFPADIEDQLSLAMKNLGRALEAAGATVTDIFKLVYYIVDYDPDNRRHTKHVQAFLNGHRPATTLVPVPVLAIPEMKFEIEAYAAVRQEALREVDVVVVGAGLSGLKAAYEVQRAGLSCVVVEARDRVGGKTWSVDPLGQGKFIDVGAAWINDTNQSKIYELANSLGLEMVVQRTTGKVIQEDLTGELGLFDYGGTPGVSHCGFVM